MASPCVYLKLAGGNVAAGKFICSVVSAAVGGEYPQQKGAGLQQKKATSVSFTCLLIYLPQPPWDYSDSIAKEKKTV